MLTMSAPAMAEVKTQGENGFSVLHIAEIDATPEQVWERLIKPGEYWSAEHSWSGSVEGFSIEPRAGGCFCEELLEEDADGQRQSVGSVEHMRVIFAHPGQVLRMQGALGPLQSEAVLGTLTVAIAPGDGEGRSKISFSYVAGGYLRYKMADIAPAVDKVLGEQFQSLIAPFVRKEKIESWSLDVEELGLNDEVLDGNAELAGPELDGKKDEGAQSKPAAKAKAGKSDLGLIDVGKLPPPDGSR